MLQSKKQKLQQRKEAHSSSVKSKDQLLVQRQLLWQNLQLLKTVRKDLPSGSQITHKYGFAFSEKALYDLTFLNSRSPRVKYDQLDCVDCL